VICSLAALPVQKQRCCQLPPSLLVLLLLLLLVLLCACLSWLRLLLLQLTVTRQKQQHSWALRTFHICH
jgi:Tfp pilus assembly protein PilN